MLTVPAVGAAAVLLGGACWKLALVVTLLAGPAASPASTLWWALTSLGLDAAVAFAVLLPGQRAPRLSTLLGLAVGVVGALDVYPAVVLGGPVTSRLLPYASSVRLHMLDARLVALSVALAVVVVVVALTGARRVTDRMMRRALATILLVSLAGVVVDGVRGQGDARARLGLDRHHVLLLVPLTSSFSPADLVPSPAVVDVAAVDPETSARAAPIIRQPAPPPRHVVLVVLESIASRHVNDTTMPRLAELARDHAVTFDDHVAETPVSIKALFALLCGLPPLPSRDLESRTIPRLDCQTVSEVLVAGGFEAGFFHGGYFAFTDKLAFLTERGFSTLVDGENIPERTGPIWKNGWGADDRVVVDEALHWVDERLVTGARTLSVVVPLIPHHEYFLPPDAARPFGTRTVLDRYRNGLRFADEVLGRLIDGYRQRGLFEDTVFVVVGDHGEAFDEHPGNRLHGGFLYEENLHTPLVIRAPALPSGAQRSRRPSTHADVAPTILGLVGVSAPKKPGALDTIAGRDLLADSFEPRPTVHFTSFPAAMLAVRGPRLKAIESTDAHVVELYDRVADPGEKFPLDDGRASASLLAHGRATLARREQVLTGAPRLGPTWLERAAASSSLPLSQQRVFNMARACIPLATSRSEPVRIVISGLSPPARFVGVGVIDDSRLKKQGGLGLTILGDNGIAAQVIVSDRFEDSSRVVPVTPTSTVTVIAAPSPKEARGCVWLSP